MTAAQQYLTGSVIAGLVLAVLFAILAGNDESNRSVYIAAAIASAAAGIVAGIVLYLRKK